MTVSAEPPSISSEEQEQLQQTIQMFEVIVLASPRDTQSLEILKDAYLRLGKATEMVRVARRLAETYAELGQYSQSIFEYEGILKRDPNNMEVMAAMGEVEERLIHSGQVRIAAPGASAPSTESGLGGPSIALDLENILSGPSLVAIDQTQQVRETHAARTVQIGAAGGGAADGNEPLARFLIQHKIAPEEVVTSALERVVKKNASRAVGTLGASLIDELVRRSSIELDALLCGILDRSKFAYLPLEYYDVDRSVVKMLPEELALSRLIVPFDIMSRTMMVAVANPFDGVGKETAQQLLDYNIQWHLCSPAAINKVLAETYRLSTDTSSLPAMRLSP